MDTYPMRTYATDSVLIIIAERHSILLLTEFFDAVVGTTEGVEI